MARKIIRRYLPSPHSLRNRRGLQFLGEVLHDPNLFHLNRHSVSVACFVGIFVAFLPIPMQMAVAALVAFWVRCNLPIAVALVWISNPITMPAMLYGAYRLGRRILQVPPMPVSFELSWEWLTHEFALIWKPLLVGSVICGLVLGTLAYLIIQVLWRWHVVSSWQERQRKRAAAKARKKQDHS